MANPNPRVKYLCKGQDGKVGKSLSTERSRSEIQMRDLDKVDSAIGMT